MQWSLGHHRIVAVDIQPWKPDDCPYAKTTTDTERRLWNAADSFRANSSLKSSEYSVPVLGMIFLRYADFKFAQAEKELAAKGSGRRVIGKEDYQRRGVLYLPPAARYAKHLDDRALDAHPYTCVSYGILSSRASVLTCACLILHVIILILNRLLTIVINGAKVVINEVWNANAIGQRRTTRT